MDKKLYNTPEAEYVELENTNVILDSTSPTPGGSGISGGGSGGGSGWEGF